VTAVSPLGEERIIAILGPGAIVGEALHVRRAAAVGVGHRHVGLRAPICQPGGLSATREYEAPKPTRYSWRRSAYDEGAMTIPRVAKIVPER
jgi:hypothetical protein